MKTIKEYKKNPLVSLILVIFCFVSAAVGIFFALNMVSLILVIFCFVSAAVGIFFALNRVFANIEHDKKWQEYDECGIF